MCELALALSANYTLCDVQLSEAVLDEDGLSELLWVRLAVLARQHAIDAVGGDSVGDVLLLLLLLLLLLPFCCCLVLLVLPPSPPPSPPPPPPLLLLLRLLLLLLVW